MRPSDSEAYRRLLQFRAKITRMGGKIHIIIPKAYHSDAEYFEKRYVVVSIVNITAEVLRTAIARPGKMLKFKARITRMGGKIHIIIPKAYHSDAEYFEKRYTAVTVVDTLFTKTPRLFHRAAVY